MATELDQYPVATGDGSEPSEAQLTWHDGPDLAAKWKPHPWARVASAQDDSCRPQQSSRAALNQLHDRSNASAKTQADQPTSMHDAQQLG